MSAHKYLLTTHRVLSFPIVEHAMESSIHPHFDPKLNRKTMENITKVFLMSAHTSFLSDHSGQNSSYEHSLISSERS